MPLSDEKRLLNAEVREEISRQRLEKKMRLAVSQACRALRALSNAPGAAPFVRYMAAVYEHRVKEFGGGMSLGQRWIVEFSPAALQSRGYYRIRLEENDLDIGSGNGLDIECQGSDGTEVRCRVALVGERCEIVVEEENRPPTGLAVLPEKRRVSLLAKITSEAVSWCGEDRLNAKATDLDAPPAAPTSWTIEASP